MRYNAYSGAITTYEITIEILNYQQNSEIYNSGLETENGEK